MPQRPENHAPVSLIVGSGGQDGFYLTQHLNSLRHRVIGITRDRVVDSASGVWPTVSLTDRTSIKALLTSVQPDFIYYLAAHHHSSQDGTLKDPNILGSSLAVHVVGLEIILTVAVSLPKRPRVFYAGSSHLFGRPDVSPQNEDTPFRPVSDYALTKQMGVQLCEFFSEHRDLFCAPGILYNHESPLRSPNFVSRKITLGVARAALGLGCEIELGDLSAVVDWGAAEDYVRAMEAILSLDSPDQFVIASGTGHSINDFVDIACTAAGIDPAGIITENPAIVVRKAQTVPLIGDPSHLKSATGWQPYIEFSKLVTQMVKSDLDLLRSNVGHLP